MVYSGLKLSIIDDFVKNYTTFETNQDNIMTFPSKYIFDLVVEYFNTLKINKSIIEKSEGFFEKGFFNVLLGKILSGAGIKEEIIVAKMSEQPDNPISVLNTIGVENLDDLTYYAEEITVNVRINEIIGTYVS